MAACRFLAFHLMTWPWDVVLTGNPPDTVGMRFIQHGDVHGAHTGSGRADQPSTSKANNVRLFWVRAKKSHETRPNF